MTTADNQAYWSSQTILVTGGGRGIGAAVATLFSGLGARVAINFKNNRAAAEQTLAACDPSRTRIYPADVANEADVLSLFDSIRADLGAVSILINNAGVTADGLLATMTLEQWKSVLDVNLTGAFLCSRSALPHMLPQKFGRIVNVSSISGVAGTKGQCNYSAAKAGLIGFTKALAKEVGAKGITVNAIAPGLVETAMLEGLVPGRREQIISSTSSLRAAGAGEVARLLEYVCGPHASFLTGAVLPFDGGR